MKIRTIIAGILLGSTLSLFAAPDAPRFDLTAPSVAYSSETKTTVFKGGAVAHVGDMRISAVQITYDGSLGVLKCVGEVKIETPDQVITATELTIEIKAKGPSSREAKVKGEK